MMEKTYNGWTNYATWRVNLEFFDSGAGEYYDADEYRQFVESYLEESSQGLALDYALAFVADVNWHEIAEHYKEEEEAA